MSLTCRTAALRLLRDLGVVSLDPATPSGQKFPIEPTDLDDTVGVMNAALQPIYRRGPSEMREQNLGAYIHGPTTVLVDVTNGLSTIANLTPYSSWMLGCTIRVGGDQQDNEVTSSTLLARPYVGSTATGVSAIVYGDAVQLDATVGKVMDPVSLPNQTPLVPCTNRMTFMMLAGYPLVTNSDGSAYGYPFFWFVRKNVSRPLFWFLEGAYNSALSYVPRRIRVAPMPDMAYSLSYRAAMNPPVITSANIDNGDHTTDPNVQIPIPDAFTESIFFPLARQRMSGLAQFKNSGTLPEITRAAKEAMVMLNLSNGQSSRTEGRYI